MNYFLAKTDPDTYSIDDFDKEGETDWDGVHNYQAINVIKTMRTGDKVFIYHSQTDKAIVGLAEVSGQPYENKSDPRFSWAVHMKFLKRLNPITLSTIKQDKALSGFKLTTHSRLSTMEVPSKIASQIEAMGS